MFTLYSRSEPVAFHSFHYLPRPRERWKSAVPHLGRNLLVDVVHHFEEVGGVHAAGYDNPGWQFNRIEKLAQKIAQESN